MDISGYVQLQQNSCIHENISPPYKNVLVTGDRRPLEQFCILL